MNFAMLKEELRPRGEYGFRDKRAHGSHLERVRVLAHIRGNKWKVEWIDPNHGLVHDAESGQLVRVWKVRGALMKKRGFWRGAGR